MSTQIEILERFAAMEAKITAQEKEIEALKKQQIQPNIVLNLHQKMERLENLISNSTHGITINVGAQQINLDAVMNYLSKQNNYNVSLLNNVVTNMELLKKDVERIDEALGDLTQVTFDTELNNLFDLLGVTYDNDGKLLTSNIRDLKEEITNIKSKLPMVVDLVKPVIKEEQEEIRKIVKDYANYVGEQIERLNTDVDMCSTGLIDHKVYIDNIESEVAMLTNNVNDLVKARNREFVQNLETPSTPVYKPIQVIMDKNPINSYTVPPKAIRDEMKLFFGKKHKGHYVRLTEVPAVSPIPYNTVK